jgi:hypothetical protein
MVDFTQYLLANQIHSHPPKKLCGTYAARDTAVDVVAEFYAQTR